MTKQNILNIMSIRFNYADEDPQAFPTIQDKMEWVLKGLEEHGVVLTPLVDAKEEKKPENF